MFAVHAERRTRAPQRERVLLAVVIDEHAVAAVERALRHRVEQAERRHHGAGGQHLDLEVAAGHVVDLLGVVERVLVEDVLRRPRRLPAHARSGRSGPWRSSGSRAWRRRRRRRWRRSGTCGGTRLRRASAADGDLALRVMFPPKIGVDIESRRERADLLFEAVRPACLKRRSFRDAWLLRPDYSDAAGRVIVRCAGARESLCVAVAAEQSAAQS